MTKDRLIYLLECYFAKTCTEAEKQELSSIVLQGEQEESINEWIETVWHRTEPEEMVAGKADQIMDSILQPPVIKAPVRRISRWWWAAAAAVIIAVCSVWLMMQNKPDKTAEENPIVATEIPSGQYKARLRLADGREIILDSAGTGAVAVQGATSVINEEGKLVYNQSTGSNKETLYNTVFTAKGQTYAMVLADGSKVWLNSASSIRFPVAFTGKDRKVEITGEAYFEVAKDRSKPFKVLVSSPLIGENGMEVQALGTAFNINAYADESIVATTLIEGAVKVSKQSLHPSGTQQVILKPGEQVQVNYQLQTINTINTDEIIAWKNGKFYFESADLKTILRQLSRWYDIEVVYGEQVSNEKFFSIMNRSSTLSDVLKTLQANDIRFRIVPGDAFGKGRKLFVNPLTR